MPDRFWVETLGCPKNAVDSDKITASLLADGLEPADGPDTAELVVVNTCAFIDAARRESIDTILTLAEVRQRGARLVVTGCLAERAGPELATSLPEVDAVVGFHGEGDLAQVLVDAPRRNPRGVRDLLELPRAAPAAPWAYVKIAEGCDRACRFCAIPTFRGKQRSRHPDALLAESRDLVTRGAVELVLVAQDLAWYGRDTGAPGALAPLLCRLDEELTPLGLQRLRLLYLYPSEVRGRLLDTMLDTPTVVPYFDLSLQHADRALLARMGRWGSGERFLTMIQQIRAADPDAAFRSSFIVGFPGETEAAHDTLLTFLDAAELDWAGFFAYSPEDGTPAATMDATVPTPVSTEWLAECEQAQAPITAAARDRLVGAELDVLVDGPDDDHRGVVGRSHREAPEIDGVIRLNAAARPGVTIRAKGIEAVGTDVLAEPIEVIG